MTVRPFIEAEDLVIRASHDRRAIVNTVSFTARKGEVVALIGESGSGKSTIALSLMGYARAGCEITEGPIRVGEGDVLAMSKAELRAFRGKDIAYFAQSAAAAFNPAKRILSQIVEATRLHRTMSPKEAAERGRVLFGDLSLPDPATIGERYVHQASGGQLQRMMAAMAMINTPDVIVFDGPRTALDVTTQVDVLRAFKALARQKGVTAIDVSHDLPVVAQMADRVVVLKDGQMMENAPFEELIQRPRNAFSRDLLAASVSRRLELDEKPREGPAALEVRGVTAGYGRMDVGGNPKVPVLHAISLRIPSGRTLGLIGESGSGKSTIGRVLAGLLPAGRGEASLPGRKLDLATPGRCSFDDRRDLQIVFQTADTALNPAQPNLEILGRPLRFYYGLKGDSLKQRVLELLDMVRLPADLAWRSPRELSGGQKQRLNLARALAAKPAVVICDEVTSELDTVVATAVVELLVELQRELGISYLFISHDLGKVHAMCNEVMVLLQGRKVELAPRDSLTLDPRHDYTRELVSAVPQLRRGWLKETGPTRRTGRAATH